MYSRISDGIRAQSCNRLSSTTNQEAIARKETDEELPPLLLPYENKLWRLTRSSRKRNSSSITTWSLPGAQVKSLGRSSAHAIRRFDIDPFFDAFLVYLSFQSPRSITSFFHSGSWPWLMLLTYLMRIMHFPTRAIASRSCMEDIRVHTRASAATQRDWSICGATWVIEDKVSRH